MTTGTRHIINRETLLRNKITLKIEYSIKGYNVEPWPQEAGFTTRWEEPNKLETDKRRTMIEPIASRTRETRLLLPVKENRLLIDTKDKKGRLLNSQLSNVSGLLCKSKLDLLSHANNSRLLSSLVELLNNRFARLMLKSKALRRS